MNIELSSGGVIELIILIGVIIFSALSIIVGVYAFIKYSEDEIFPDEEEDAEKPDR